MSKSKKNSNGLCVPPVLSFPRRLAVSDALMYACQWQGRGDNAPAVPLTLVEKAVRGTSSSRPPAAKGKSGTSESGLTPEELRLKRAEADALKQDASARNPNLQRVDSCSLPEDADTLAVQFTLRVLGDVGEPTACTDADFKKAMGECVAGYAAATGFKALAGRYAANLANGRFLWRNRLCAESVEVVVGRVEGGEVTDQWTFDALAHDLNDVDNFADHELSGVIADALSGKFGSAGALFTVLAFARIGRLQEVYPSQELVMDNSADKNGKKSKFLYSVGDQAAMHSQKIGNALRTIDVTHAHFDDLGPIAVEPYGSVTTIGQACRSPVDKADFYSLFDEWMTTGNPPAVEDQHFVIANLIRGGVFGLKGD